eukprot:4783568-Pleurochrysis_carterae.AAC.1
MSAATEAAHAVARACTQAIISFCARGTGRPGFPPVSAPLSDPNASVDEGAIPQARCTLLRIRSLRFPHAAAALHPCALAPRATWVVLCCWHGPSGCTEMRRARLYARADGEQVDVALRHVVGVLLESPDADGVSPGLHPQTVTRTLGARPPRI